MIIVTQDKDFHQVIGESVVTYDPFKEYIMGLEGVHKRYNLPPQKLVFYYALVGDAIDNIPGVTGIGPKEAQRLVEKYSSLTNLYEHMDEIKDERIRELLQEHKKEAFISLKLFKLKYYEFHMTPQDCAFDKNNWVRAYPLFKELEFHSLIKESEEQRQKNHK